MDFLDLMKNRYTTKYYDEDKKIPQDLMDKILECYRLTPTAVNIQSTHAFLITDKVGKGKIRDAVPDFNLQRFDTCSAVIILCARDEISASELRRVAEKEASDGRFKTQQEITARAEHCRGYVESRRNFDGIESWTGKQAYLAMATILYAAASYGIDSTPIEGVDTRKVDELLGLDSGHLRTQAMVLLGYRSSKDSNTLDKRPKSRLKLSDIMTEI